MSALRKRIDRLAVVAHDGEIPAFPRDQLQQPVLGLVGVLVLVDQDPAEGALVAVADVLEELEQVDGANQEVVEVHRVGLVHALFVEAEDVGDGLLEERALALAEPLGVQQAVLRAGDLGLDRARREPLGVDLELLHAALDHPQRVGLVVDREGALVAQALGVRAQDPRARRVERHHPHQARYAADQLLDALPHLGGGLVGEGDREDLAGARLARGDQVGDAVRQRPGLPGAGAREHQQRPLPVLHRLALGRVQVGQAAARPGLRRASGVLRRPPRWAHRRG